MTIVKTDIQSRADVEQLVNRFYDKVKSDTTIGYIFNDLVKVNWETHLPVMYDFWESVIFFTGTYTGNPMITHRKLHQIAHLTAEHFKTWLAIFTSTVDEMFTGEKAELAKQRAMSMAMVMQLKIY
ncbi:MAG: group III truncated hemoglobin [Chitinophagaceae bacterium]